MNAASLAFLKKVEAGEVFRSSWYSSGGMKYATKGGERTLQRHIDGGWVSCGHSVSMGQRAYATLTDAGRAVLEAAR